MTYNSTDSPITTKLQLKLQDNLLTNRSTFCQTTSSDDVVNFFPVNFISSKLIECDIIKTKYLNNIDIIDVKIIVNASEPFEVTSNNQTLLFVKENLKWKSKRVINPDDVLSSLDFSIPNREFNYELKIIGFNETLNCSYSIESNPNCYLPFNYFKTFKIIPMNIEFEFYIQDKNTNNLKKIQVDFMTYYEFTSIEHLKPFIISHSESLKIPIRIISNALRGLSKQFDFICNITQNTEMISSSTLFDVKANEFESGLNSDSFFTCSFLTFGNSKDNYNLTISFNSIEGVKSLIKSGNEGKIYLKNDKIVLPISFGSKYGNYQIGPISTLKYQFPTQIYSNYNYSIKLLERGTYHELNQFNVTKDSFYLELPDVSKWYFQWNEVLKSLKLDLFINSVKSFSLDTKFNYYGVEIIDISPSNLIPIGDPRPLDFKIKEKWNYIGLIQMKYTTEMNQTEIVNCKRTKDVLKITCISPNFNQSSTVSISISISNGDFIQSNMKVILYENEMKISSIKPTIITNVYQFVTIKGSSFKNISTIKTKFQNLNMKEVVISKLIQSDTIVAPIPKAFYVENVKYPLDLKVSLSFDNGISYSNSNLTIQVASLSKILNCFY